MFNHDCDCCKPMDKNDHHRPMKKEKENCCCIDGLADQLKKFRGHWVVIFEKNAVVWGFIKEVKDKDVVILEDAIKVLLNSPYYLPPFFEFDKLIISICEIIEFAPCSPTYGDTFKANMQNAATKKAE